RRGAGAIHGPDPRVARRRTCRRSLASDLGLLHRAACRTADPRRAASAKRTRTLHRAPRTHTAGAGRRITEPTEDKMTDGNITKDSMYDAVAPDDFESMIELDRYEKRSTAFDKIISATHDHFWDPLDKKYIDFSLPFDMENEYLVDPKLSGGLKTAIGDKLDEKQKIKLTNL